MAAPYFILITNDLDRSSTNVGIMLSYVTIIGLAGIAYLFNDVSDIEVDRKAGKENALLGMAKNQIAILGAFFTMLAIGPWFWFLVDQWSLVLLGSEILLFYLYAFRPFRLKERGWAGVITDALYAHLIPAVLAAHTFNLIGGKHFTEISIFLVYLCIWQFFLGVRNILWHQLSDEEADRTSGVKTLVTEIGADSSNRIRNWLVIPLEVLSFLAFAWFINGFIHWFLPAFGVFVIFTFINKKENRRLTISKITNNYLDDFYIRWYPLLILAALILTDVHFLFIVLAHLILFRNGVVPLFKNIWQLFLPAIHNLSFWPWKAKSNAEIERRNHKLAICSTNRKKYSETFIHMHYELLQEGDLLLCDGYLPTSISIDHGEHFYPIRKIKTSLFRKKALSESEALEQLLVKHKISVVLTEYGPAGVMLLPICKKLGINLIVHFHGYDAYRDDVLSTYGLQYKALFAQASKVISVSNDMSKQLQKLGCDSEKIEEMAYGIDTDFFTRAKDLNPEKTIVFCGRFVAKKSPESVIKAFKIISEQIPSTNLIMIGDGELLERCKALAKALNLDQKISFTGALTPAEVVAQLQGASVYLQHSLTTPEHDSEGTPVSLLEAMALELAVVATSHGGIREVISNNENGILILEGDIMAMAAASVQLLEDEETRKRLGKAARLFILKHHKKAQYLEELRRIVQLVAQ